VYLGYGLAIVIGLSLGLLGGGGSILTVPVLVYVLGYGVKEAVPLSLVVVGVTSAFGAANHQRAGNIRWDAALAFGPSSMVGAFLGGRLAALVPGRWQLGIFAVLMLAAAISMFFGPALWGGRDSATAPRRRPWPLIALLGGAVGALTGLVGVGGGFMYVPALVLLGEVAMRQAVGTSLVLIAVGCVAGLLGHLGQVELHWRAAGLFTALAIVGVLVGSALVTSVSQSALRRAFAVFLMVMGVFVLLKPR
jgi:uncharacterized membrane protein YfcA